MLFDVYFFLIACILFVMVLIAIYMLDYDLFLRVEKIVTGKIKYLFSHAHLVNHLQCFVNTDLTLLSIVDTA